MVQIREDLRGLLCGEMNADKRRYSKPSAERSAGERWREKFLSPDKEFTPEKAAALQRVVTHHKRGGVYLSTTMRKIQTHIHTPWVPDSGRREVKVFEAGRDKG